MNRPFKNQFAINCESKKFKGARYFQIKSTQGYWQMKWKGNPNSTNND